MRLSVDNEAAGWNRKMNGDSLEMNAKFRGLTVFIQPEGNNGGFARGENPTSRRDCDPGMPTSDQSIPWGLRSVVTCKKVAYERELEEGADSKAATESDELGNRRSRVMPVEGVAYREAPCSGRQHPNGELGEMLETKLSRIAERLCLREALEAKATLESRVR
jgi:hypothetical protein